jgi:excinuclease UvrABC nuclease subunit
LRRIEPTKVMLSAMNIDITALRQSSKETVGHESGVYFLFHGEELVYIGEGWNCFLRVAEHTRKDSDRVFTHWNFVPVESKDERKALERALRNQYKPKFNKI